MQHAAPHVLLICVLITMFAPHSLSSSSPTQDDGSDVSVHVVWPRNGAALPFNEISVTYGTSNGAVPLHGFVAFIVNGAEAGGRTDEPSGEFHLIGLSVGPVIVEVCIIGHDGVTRVACATTSFQIVEPGSLNDPFKVDPARERLGAVDDMRVVETLQMHVDSGDLQPAAAILTSLFKSKNASRIVRGSAVREFLALAKKYPDRWRDLLKYHPLAGTTARCGDDDIHELNGLTNKLHSVNPYTGFDSAGLQYSSEEFQGHDDVLMEFLVHILAPRLVVEVGSWKGGSAIKLARMLKDRGWACRSKVLCVDTWLGTSTEWKFGNTHNLRLVNGFPSVYREFLNNIIQSDCSDVVVPLPLPSSVAAEVLRFTIARDQSPAADLVFVDGNHDYDDVKLDVSRYWALLSPGGLMFGDDFRWMGVRKAVTEFANEKNLTVHSPNGRTWIMY